MEKGKSSRLEPCGTTEELRLKALLENARDQISRHGGWPAEAGELPIYLIWLPNLAFAAWSLLLFRKVLRH